MLKPALAFAICLTASPGLADDLLFFRSPSGNINCVLATGDYAAVRCDIAQFTPSFNRRPDGCDLDWGDSFEITLTGRTGVLGCHGDTVITPDAFTLEYDDALESGGFSCISRTTGMTCTNPRGHGFTVSKAAQRLF